MSNSPILEMLKETLADKEAELKNSGSRAGVGIKKNTVGYSQHSDKINNDNLLSEDLEDKEITISQDDLDQVINGDIIKSFNKNIPSDIATADIMSPSMTSETLYHTQSQSGNYLSKKNTISSIDLQQVYTQNQNSMGTPVGNGFNGLSPHTNSNYQNNPILSHIKSYHQPNPNNFNPNNDYHHKHYPKVSPSIGSTTLSPTNKHILIQRNPSVKNVLSAGGLVLEAKMGNYNSGNESLFGSTENLAKKSIQNSDNINCSSPNKNYKKKQICPTTPLSQIGYHHGITPMLDPSATPQFQSNQLIMAATVNNDDFVYIEKKKLEKIRNSCEVAIKLQDKQQQTINALKDKVKILNHKNENKKKLIQYLLNVVNNLQQQQQQQ